jgi:hypothetical protein
LKENITMKKQLLITFDYELFLGSKSGTIDDCLFSPSNLVLEVMEKHNVKAIFFVDTSYLLTLKKYANVYAKCGRDFNLINSHLQTIIRKGHYIFPHIHPHWLDAVYIPETNEWNLNGIDKYRFHSITQEERESLFDGSVALLKEIIQPINPEYKIDTYRAGGWCIQPFEDFLPFYKKHGFKYDFSVLAGFYLFSSVQYFDFSKSPVKSIYNFSTDVVEEDANGEFTEFNLSSVKINRTLRMLHKFWLKTLHRVFDDHSYNRGKGQIAKEYKTDIKSDLKVHNILTSSHERISIELLTLPKLNSYLKHFEKNDYVHFISHPKMLIKHHLKTFDKFLTEVLEKYEVETDFKKMV